MPVKVRKRSGTYKGKKFKYVTVDPEGTIKSRHTSRKNANTAARIRNRAIKKKR